MKFKWWVDKFAMSIELLDNYHNDSETCPVFIDNDALNLDALCPISIGDNYE